MVLGYWVKLMKCEKCMACKSFWNGIEEESYCQIGILEDEAYHDGVWYCRFNQRTIEKRLRDKVLAVKEKDNEKSSGSI